MKIAIVGAFDRMNYGDLLFPLVLTKTILKRHGNTVNIAYYGHRGADLTEFGGFLTKPMRMLFSPKELPGGSAVIVAGGEVLAASWVDTLYYLLGRKPWWQRLANKLFGMQAESVLIRRYLGCRNVFPYLFNKSDFSEKVAIIYNAVGGTNLQIRSEEFRKSVASVLLGADYLAVRDQQSINILNNTRVKLPNLVMAPDSAAIISELFPVDLLEEIISSEAVDIKSELNGCDYLVFQIGINFSSGSEKVISEQINELINRTGFSVVLLPIGRASGHEDHKAMEKLIPLLCKPVIMPKFNTLFDTMWLIANSKVFIGSSLHGAITAISYGIPHLSLTKKDKKIPAFLETWDLPSQKECVEYSDICRSAENRLTIPKEDLIRLRNDFVTQANASMNHINDVLNNIKI